MAYKEKFVILDGNALLHRAYHALPPITTKDGVLVNAVYGFTSILLKIIRELKPDYLALAFDRAGKSLRAEAFKEYKAHRVKQPDELYSQIPLIEKIAAAFRIPVIDSAETGHEADDVIGTVVKVIKDKHPQVKSIIVTGDLDTLQLVDEQTEVFTFKKGISDSLIYSPETVKQRYSLPPEKLIDYKALRGDPSDNIPGVRGIGEKTASTLIQTFGSLEKLYASLEKNDAKAQKLSPRIAELLKTQKAEAILSKQLVTIKTDLKTNFDLQETKLDGFNEPEIVRLFTELEFKSLLNKIPMIMAGKAAPETKETAKEPGLEQKTKSEFQGRMEFVRFDNSAEKKKFNYRLIDTAEKFSTFIKELKQQKQFCLDSETTSLNVWEAELLGLSFSWQADQAFFVALNFNDKSKIKLAQNWLAELKPILEDPKIKIIGHNLKYDYEILLNHGVKPAGLYFDTLIAAYLLTSGEERNLSLSGLVFSELGYQMQELEELIGPRGKNQLPVEQVLLEKLSWYSCEDADFSLKLYQKLSKRLEEIADFGLLTEMEMPLIYVLAEMEKNGIKIDAKLLNKLSQEFAVKIKKLEQQIYRLAGEEFNVASPLQLKKILFEKLNIGIKGLKNIKTGISTAAMELEKLKDKHPIINLISEFREYSKLQNTYLLALPKLVSPKTKRVHTSFNQTIAATGRLSSSNPNLQNIPIRTDIGKQIRQAFIAEKGYSLISADYSQIELRVIASLAKDAKMIESFKKGEDIHKRTAANINKVPLEQVTPAQRYAAKEVNFGIMYGLGYVGLAQRAGIPREEAKAFIEEYFMIHPSIRNWLDETKELAREKGYVETLFGRRRYLPNINSGMQMLKAASERMAINMPIQGTAADLLKMAMIKIHPELPEISPKSKMLLTVHDELVLETPENEIDKVSKFLKEIMENIYILNVPIKAEVHAGKTWGDCK